MDRASTQSCQAPGVAPSPGLRQPPQSKWLWKASCPPLQVAHMTYNKRACAHAFCDFMTSCLHMYTSHDYHQGIACQQMPQLHVGLCLEALKGGYPMSKQHGSSAADTRSCPYAEGVGLPARSSQTHSQISEQIKRQRNPNHCQLTGML